MLFVATSSTFFILLVYTIVLGAQSRLPAVRRLNTVLRNVLGYFGPTVYAIVLAFCMYLFDSRCLEYAVSPTHQRLVRLQYSLPFVALALATFSNPGIITPANHEVALHMFPYDRILYFPQRECRTCRFEKPARSKHCSSCGGCVAVADHHCVWINNCVGVNNWDYFYFFLVVSCYLFLYGGYLQYAVLRESLAREKWDWQLPMRLSAVDLAHHTALCLLVLCVLIGLIACSYTGYHFYLLARGVTTNESVKWDDVDELAREGALYAYKNSSNSSSSIVLQSVDGAWNRGLTLEERALVDRELRVLVPVRSRRDIKNVYDRGFWGNLQLIFKPRKLK